MGAPKQKPGAALDVVDAASPEVPLRDVLGALADEISDMENVGRSLEGLVARLASPALTEDGVVEGLQQMDHLMQRIGVMCRVVSSLAETSGPVNQEILSNALDAIVLEDVKEKLRQRIYGDEIEENPDDSGEVEFF